MVLYLTATQLYQIQTQAERTYPEECCGLLLGQFDRSGDPEVYEIWETANAWTAEVTAELSFQLPAARIAEGAKRDRYWIDPRDLLKAQRYCRDRDWTILGIYHSHPDHAAIPSECDRVLAWAEYVYVIVSVQQGRAQDVLGWRLDANHQFQPAELRIIEADLSGRS